jgi:hypothetical protein
MLVTDAIKELEKLNAGDELVIAWWEKTAFDNIPKKHWEAFVEHVENKMDWSGTHEDLEAEYDVDDHDDDDDDPEDFDPNGYAGLGIGEMIQKHINNNS